MLKRYSLMVMVGILTFTGCAQMSDTQRKSASGAGVGAATGAIIGVLAGGGKGAAIGAATGAAVGAAGGYVWSKHMEKQRQEMEAATRGTGVSVMQTADNQLKLEIPSDISFDTGKAEIKPELRPILDKFAATLVQNPVTNVHIIGHTDSTGSDAVNDPLSVRRASSARSFIAARGVAGSRISVDGRGSNEPVADNTTVSGRAKNRRIEIFVAEAVPPQSSGQY